MTCHGPRTVPQVLHDQVQDAWLDLVNTCIDRKTGKYPAFEYAVTASGRVLQDDDIRLARCRVAGFGTFDRRVTLEQFCSEAFAAFSELIGGVGNG